MNKKTNHDLRGLEAGTSLVYLAWPACASRRAFYGATTREYLGIDPGKYCTYCPFNAFSWTKHCGSLLYADDYMEKVSAFGGTRYIIPDFMSEWTGEDSWKGVT